MGRRKKIKVFTENDVQRYLAETYRNKGYTVAREYEVEVGYIDILYYGVDKEGNRVKSIVEVKERSSIKHAIGQIETYRKYIEDTTKLEIVYFDYDGIHRGINKVYSQFNHIEIKSIHTVLDLRHLHIKDNKLVDININREEDIECQNTLLREQEYMIQELYQSIELGKRMEEPINIRIGNNSENIIF